MEVAAEENERSSDPHEHTRSQHSQSHWQSPYSTVSSQTSDQTTWIWNIEYRNVDTARENLSQKLCQSIYKKLKVVDGRTRPCSSTHVNPQID